MKRLTQWDEYGNADIIALSDMMPEVYSELSFSETNALTDVLNRLAAYEDTGLEPEEVDALKTAMMGKSIAEIKEFDEIPISRLQKLARAEKDGRLVVTPCKVGDTVWTNLAMSGWYFRDKDKPYTAKVVFVGLNNSEEMGGGLFNIVYAKGDRMLQFCFSAIGKTVFLTREEAEAALKKEDNDG